MNLDILSKLKTQGTYRHLESLSGIDFSSNDYLGLSKSSILKNKLLNFIESEKYLWSSSSRMISGTTPLHLEVEDQLAQFLNRQKTLLFHSGYSANCGVISALCSKSLIFSDEFNHASIIDGIRLSQSEYLIYPHNDLDALERLLKKFASSPQPKFVITESLFSMEGDLTPVKNLVSLTQKFGASLILDEAHSTGIYGSQGQGLLAELDVDSKFNPHKIISIHTGGKALGACGAFVGCSSKVKDLLVNTCRHFIYTTALHPLNVFLLSSAVNYVKDNPKLRRNLFENIAYTQKTRTPQHPKSPRTKSPRAKSPRAKSPRTKSSRVTRTKSPRKDQVTKSQVTKDQVIKGQMTTNDESLSPFYLSPIIPWIYPGNENVLRLSKQLKDLGFNVKAIRSPTVPHGKERLRLSIHAHHKKEDIDSLITSIKHFTGS